MSEQLNREEIRKFAMQIAAMVPPTTTLALIERAARIEDFIVNGEPKRVERAA